MELKDFFRSDLLFVKLPVKNREKFFEEISVKANSLGYVTDDFEVNVKKREETFPTGIQLEDCAIAIPHTDAEYVKEEFISVVTFENPVKFNSMEEANAVLDVEVAFLLGLNKSHNQLEVLTKLMTLIQNKEVIDSIVNASDKHELEEILKTI